MNLKAAMSEASTLYNVQYFFVLPEHLLADISPETFFEDDFWTNPIGSGPFIFESEVFGERVVYSANKDYYNGAPSFEQLTVRYVNDANLLSGLMNGEIDIAPCFLTNFPLADLEMAEEEGLGIEYGAAVNVCYLIANNNVFSKEERCALASAINKERLIEVCGQGHGKAWNSIYLTDDYFYNGDVEGVIPAYDPEGAKATLEACGFDFEREYTLIATSGNTLREQVAILLQEDFAEIGIKINIQSLDMATEMNMLRDEEAEFGLMGGLSGTYEPTNHSPFYVPDGTYNLGHVDSEKYWSYLDAISGCLTEEEIMEYSYPLQMEVAEDMPYLYLMALEMISVYNPRIEGINFDNLVTWNYNWSEWTFN